MISCILIDDDPLNNVILKDALEDNFPEIRIDAIATSVVDAVEAIKKNPPDVVFLDIEMPGENGFDLFKYFEKINFNVIFITSYDQFAIKAFKFSATDYILKPIEIEDLKKAIEKIRQQKHIKLKLDQIELLSKSLSRSKNKISIENQNGYDLVDLEDIIRCEAKINYTEIFLKNNKKIIAAKTLKEFEEALPAAIFFRIHKSHIVNMYNIKGINKRALNNVVMLDGTAVPIARRRKEAFFDEINKLESGNASDNSATLTVK